jgi:transcriptional repressor NF-X1
MCGKIRKCGHACEEKCHALEKCPEEKKCPAKVIATCECGLQKLEVACNATASSSGSKRVLACNDYCARADRNRKLAVALEINRPTNPDEAELVDYPDDTRAFYVSNPTWCRGIVAQLNEFVQDAKKRHLHFKPMKIPQRKFIHEMCEVYRLKSEGIDPEPYRSVVVSKSQGEGQIPKNPISVAAYQKRKASGSLANITSSIPPIAIEQLRKPFKPAINAIYLAELGFGLVKEDLDRHLEHAFGSIKFVSKWLDTNAVAMPYTGSMSLEEVEVFLLQIRKELRSTLIPQDIATHVDCCWVNRDGDVVWPGGKSPYEKAKDAIAAKEGDHKAAPVRVENTFGALQEDSDIMTEAEDEDGWTTVKRNIRPSSSMWNDVSDVAGMYVSPAVLETREADQGTEQGTEQGAEQGTEQSDESDTKEPVENWEALEE